MNDRAVRERMIVGALALMGVICVGGIIYLAILDRQIPAILTSLASFVTGAMAGVLHAPVLVKRENDGTKP